MVEIRKTVTFERWLDGLRDLRARARIQVRIERLAAGHAGDVKSVGEGVIEMRIDCGPGYRVYFTKRGKPVAKLVPIKRRAKDGIFGWLRSMGSIQGDIVNPALSPKDWGSLGERDEMNTARGPRAPSRSINHEGRWSRR